MKKIIIILFLFLLLFACYYIYNITEDNKLDIVVIGDTIGDNPYLDNIGVVNNYFVNKDYHVIDILDTIKYNKEIDVDNKYISIHQLLKRGDIIIISIGIGDIYYKLDDSTKEIYTYMNDIINNYNEILRYINKYSYKKVYVLGYFNTYDRYDDIFTYIDYKLRNIVNRYGYTYIDLDKTIGNNSNLYEKRGKFDLNSEGYCKIYELIVENLNKY